MDVAKLSYVHAHMRYIRTSDGDEVLLPERAYKNTAWLASHGAKTVRILSEFLEPEQRFIAANVKHTILFFGSARARSPDEHAAAVTRAEAAVADASLSARDRDKQAAVLARLRKTAWMSAVYVQVEELARKLAAWSMGRIGADERVPYIIATGERGGVQARSVRPWRVGRSLVPAGPRAARALALDLDGDERLRRLRLHRFHDVLLACAGAGVGAGVGAGKGRRSVTALRLRVCRAGPGQGQHQTHHAAV